MIHLSKVSINPAAIAYIHWQAKSNSQSGIKVRFCYSSQEYSGDYCFFPEDSEDAKTLARELKRPSWSKSQPTFEPSPGSLLPDAE